MVPPSSDAEEKKIAELEARLKKAEKEIAEESGAARSIVPASPPAPASVPVASEPPAENVPKNAGLRGLRPAFERLDPSKKPDARLSQADFEFAVESARRA